MSVAYEPRSFIHEGVYPSMGDEEHQRFTDSEVAEHLSHYTTEATMLPDDREILGDDREIMPTTMPADDANILSGDERSIIHVPVDDRSIIPDDRGLLHHDTTTDQDVTRLELGNDFSSPLESLQPPPLTEPIPESQGLSPGPVSPSAQSKGIIKPEREVSKGVDGKYHCPLEDCKEECKAFSRKCEWNKHMDKHERPYRCLLEGCENLPGFTYSGGLLRHEREVHGKYGGPKNTVNCPHATCKRHTGKGFSRQENLNEHLRRVHTSNTESDNTSPEATAGPQSPNADASETERSGSKRKRRSSSDEVAELRDEIKRVRKENEDLKKQLDTHRENSLSMMAQIAELQDTLRHGLGNASGLGAPTAQMI